MTDTDAPAVTADDVAALRGADSVSFHVHKGKAYRHVDHTDHQHEAREDGAHRGYEHANYVAAYGETTDTTIPDQYADVADVWAEAYQEGKDEYAATQEDEAMYGHDWRA